MTADAGLTTVVTAADSNYAWGVLLLAASMRRVGMEVPLVVGAVDWPERARARLKALGGVTVVGLGADRRTVACQKPVMMAHPAVETPWVSWADGDGVFVGDCSDLMTPANPGEILIRKYDPPPPDVNPETFEVWRRDVGERSEPRLSTRVNTAFLTLSRERTDFLDRWRRQMEKVLPANVGIVMRPRSPYFQTDESVLGSLLAFADDAPAVAEPYTMDGRTTGGERYFAHFAYNPKPWQMWNPHCFRWYGEVLGLADWLVESGVVARRELPFALERSHAFAHRAMAPLAANVWRVRKRVRRILERGRA